VRPDGRSAKDIRPIWCEIDVSPRAHGSGLFTRGETQVLTLATLGTPREAQEIDSLSPSESKRASLNPPQGIQAGKSGMALAEGAPHNLANMTFPTPCD
jgi:hypothetical protein